jgi:hypothetical protein
MAAEHNSGEVYSAPQRKAFRPREVWAGTILMLLALLLAAAAVILSSLLLSILLGIAAAVVFVAGGLVAWHGRIFRDTHARSPVSREWRDLTHPEEGSPAGLDPRDKGRLNQDRR